MLLLLVPSMLWAVAVGWSQHSSGRGADGNTVTDWFGAYRKEFRILAWAGD